MAKSDKYMAEHVRSAKIWLERAERSFDSQSDIKGELNLMLAEAEMKNLRKKKTNRRYKSFVTAGVAVVVAAVLGSAFFLYTRQTQPVPQPVPAWERQSSLPVPKPVTPTGPVPEQTAPIEVTPAELEGPAYASPEQTGEAEAQTGRDGVTAPPPASVQAPAEPAAPPTEDTPVLTDRQIQAAVQDARHTLRSTANETN